MVHFFQLASFKTSVSPENSATIFEGSWMKLRVALKVLKTADGITPSPEVSL